MKHTFVRFRLVVPFLLLPAVYIPYNYLNSVLIVKWLGCSCPNIDSAGNIVYRAFNANDFTLLFWGVMAVVAIGLSVWLARRLSRRWMWAGYVAAVAAIVFTLAWAFYRSMIWD